MVLEVNNNEKLEVKKLKCNSEIIIINEIRGIRSGLLYNTHARARIGKMESMHLLSVKSIVRGYHVFTECWDPSPRDTFDLQVEEFNQHDTYAAPILVNGETVGHVPREVFKIFYYFFKIVVFALEY